MADPIDRQTAIDAVWSIEHIARLKDGDTVIRTSAVDYVLKMLPSAQTEIIRCRDCEHWDKTWTNNWSHDYHYCPKIDEVRKGDFYCRYAERRTDE